MTVKTALTAFAAAMALAGTAWADGPGPVAYTPEPAPVAPAAYDWTGLYAGVALGFGRGNSEHGDATGQTGGAPTFPESDPDGGVVSLYFGYNHQMANNVVLGFEVDYTASDMEGVAASTGTYGCGDGCVAEVESFATARIRLGYAMDQWLPYVTAGIASTQYRGELITIGSGTSTQTSAVYGIGVDYDVNGSGWVARGEILHVTDPGSFVFDPANCAAPGCGLRQNDYTVFRLGIAHRF